MGFIINVVIVVKVFVSFCFFTDDVIIWSLIACCCCHLRRGNSTRVLFYFGLFFNSVFCSLAELSFCQVEKWTKWMIVSLLCFSSSSNHFFP